MATKLKNLAITSTDLVDAGANPDAHIRLFKSAHNSAKKFVDGLKKSTEKQVTQEVFPVILKNLEEDLELSAVPDLMLEDEPETGIGLLEEEENYMKMKFAKNGVVMSENDLKALETLAKRYGLQFEEEETSEIVEKSVDVQTAVELEIGQVAEEVAKSKEFEEFAKMSQELETLKKSLTMKNLEEEASPYEILGKKKGELAETFYKMKAVGDEMFSAYKEVLDEQLAIVGKSALFVEKGSCTSGESFCCGFESKVSEIIKRDGVSHATAMVKAYEENPELAMEYEKSYVGKEI